MANWIAALSVAVLSVTAAGLARAEVIWRGDFETGDLSQWSKAQEVSSDRLTLVSNPCAQGRYALRAEVQPGDNPIGASGNRNELVYATYEPAGTERYFRWQTRWASDYPSFDTWQLFTQWHHSGDSGSPPVEFFVRGEQIILNVYSEPAWSTPLVRGKWFDFVFHVKWSPDPSEGFIELWVDGQNVVPLRHLATQYPGQSQYLKQGLYRSETVDRVGVVYHDGMTLGTTLADVAPSTSIDASGATVIAPVHPGAAPTQGMDDGEIPQGGCSAAGLASPMPGLVLAGFALLRRRRR